MHQYEKEPPSHSSNLKNDPESFIEEYCGPAIPVNEIEGLPDVCVVHMLYPMDIGNGGYTEFDNYEDILELFDDHPEWEDDKYTHGLMHSHNTMGTFFSGTDQSTQIDGASSHTMFLSIITNNKSEIIARLSTPMSFYQKSVVAGVTQEIEDSFVADIKAEIITINTKYDDELILERHQQLKDAVAESSKIQTINSGYQRNYYNYGQQGIWDTDGFYGDYNVLFLNHRETGFATLTTNQERDNKDYISLYDRIKDFNILDLRSYQLRNISNKTAASKWNGNSFSNYEEFLMYNPGAVMMGKNPSHVLLKCVFDEIKDFMDTYKISFIDDEFSKLMIDAPDQYSLSSSDKVKLIVRAMFGLLDAFPEHAQSLFNGISDGAFFGLGFNYYEREENITGFTTLFTYFVMRKLESMDVSEIEVLDDVMEFLKEIAEVTIKLNWEDMVSNAVRMDKLMINIPNEKGCKFYNEYLSHITINQCENEVFKPLKLEQ